MNPILTCRIIAATSITLVLFAFGTRLQAQHARYEGAISFAVAGQKPVVTAGDARSGFWRQPFIVNLRAQVATDYITSASLFLESIAEERTRTDLWSDEPNTSDPPPYNARITEQLSLTLFGVEAARTVVRSGDFRLAVTLGVGYGLGGARASVTNLLTAEKKSFESCDFWHGLYLGGSLRGRYTLYQSNTYDIGLTASARVWGFPTIGPFGDCITSYNGPGFSSIFEIGYLAGISVGFL